MKHTRHQASAFALRGFLRRSASYGGQDGVTCQALSAILLGALVWSTAGLPAGAQTQTPFRGTPSPIPGAIQAENFDTGGEGIAYHDTTAANLGGKYRTSEGVDIGGWASAENRHFLIKTIPQEWTEYTVNVTTGGLYEISVRLSMKGTGGILHFELDGTPITGPIAVPNTGGWFNWRQVQVADAPIPGGVHVLRMVLDKAGVSGSVAVLDSFSFTLTDAFGPVDVSLTVEGNPADYGTSAPYDYGVHQTPVAEVITNTVSASVTGCPGMRHHCIGWTGTGSVPATGDVNTVVFTNTLDSTLTWNWRMEYFLDTTAGPGGTVDTGDGWHPEGARITVSALANADYQFVKWIGNVPADSVSNRSVTVSMAGPVHLVALFDAGTHLRGFTISGHPDEYGAATPYGYGFHEFSSGRSVYNTVTSPVEGENGVQYICTGWMGTGSVPEIGHTNEVSFTITEDSALSWQWRANPAEYEFQGHKYRAVTNRVTWYKAKAAAEAAGGYLAIPNNAEENDFLRRTAQQAKLPTNIWLGGTDEATEGEWRWVDGTLFGYSNWYPGEPNNLFPPQGEDYLELWISPLPEKEGKWNDAGNNNLRDYIIEFDCDLDGDGMPDWWEEQYRGVVMFEDDFNDGNDDGWEQRKREWHVINGQYVADGAALPGVPYGHPNVRGAASFAHMGDTTWSNYSFEVVCGPYDRPAGAWWPYGNLNSVDYFFAFCRVKSFSDSIAATGTEAYRITYTSPSTTHVQPSYFSAAYYFADETGGHLITNGFCQAIREQSNHVAMVVNGTNWVAYINGKRIFAVSLPERGPLSGGIGLGSLWETGAWFDDVVVRRIGMLPHLDDADLDYDGDGIVNIEEFERGTDPLSVTLPRSTHERYPAE